MPDWKKTLRLAALVVLVAVGVYSIVATTPPPELFARAEPTRVCPGSDVVLSWEDIEGTPVRITATPATAVDPPLGTDAHPSSGSLQVRILEAVVFELSGNGPPVILDPMIPAAGIPVTVRNPGTCSDGRAVWNPVTVSAEQAGQTAVVGGVALDTSNAGYPGTVRVGHGGLTTTVGPSAPSAALNGTLLTGSWTLEPVEAVDDRICLGAETEPPPPFLPVIRLSVTATCVTTPAAP